MLLTKINYISYLLILHITYACCNVETSHKRTLLSGVTCVRRVLATDITAKHAAAHWMMGNLACC